MTGIDEYDYQLPPELIAQQPLDQRADARLLVVHRRTESWEHWHVRDLPELLNPGDCLVANDTRVIPARLVGFRTQTGGRWFGLFLDVDASGNWLVLAKTRGRVAEGETVTLLDRDSREGLKLEVLLKLPGGQWVVRPNSQQDHLELLERYGRVPLPHYIRDGEMVAEDQQRYQTVFAREPGAVAAPTAGLHFTPQLLERLRLRSIGFESLTLHVGIGTFRPITANNLDDHRMHSERGELTEQSASRLNAVRAAGGRLIAVGTTSVRVLETVARQGPLAAWQGETDLFIRPPFSFHAVDGLLTNFHLPKSTLLLLVSAFAGKSLIRIAYDEAIQQRYRFFSYGDAMLIL